MTEAPAPKINYQGNSNVDKAAASTPAKAESRVKKIEGMSVTQKKTGLGKRIKDSFGGQDLKSVGLYLVLEVMVPASRDLLFDLIKEGGHRAIYGDTVRRQPTIGSSILGGNRLKQTSYSSISSSPLSGGRRAGDTNITQRERSQFDFSGLVIADRVLAQEVLERMGDAIEEYGVVTVADFYDLMEISGNGFTDQTFGWDAKAFSTADAKKVRDGYILDLAEPRAIKQ